MRSLSFRACASSLLAATLLPLSAFAQSTQEANASQDAQPMQAQPMDAQPMQAQPMEAQPAPVMQQGSEPLASAADVPYSPGAESPMGPAQNKSLWRYSSKPGSTQLDLGASLGFNSPSGFFGGELEYRILPFLGLNVSGGKGLWGTRVGPLARLYPLGEVPLSPFVEAGLSFNFGGSGTVQVNDGPVRQYDQLFAPSATVGIGSRLALGRLFYVSSRVGYAWNLRGGSLQMRDGQPPDGITALAMDFARQDGYVISGALGMSFF